MVVSAGTLLYRCEGERIEVLLVHPSGAYNRRSPWGIPKGIPDEGEALIDAARRETREEAGVEAPAELLDLGEIRYTKTRKIVHCFAGPAPEDADPRPASWEVDGARFFPLEEAHRVIHPDQRPLLARLEQALST